jgi:hydrogenase maturation protein HypF
MTFPANNTGSQHRRRIEIDGIVQGVGFRPFVYNLACGMGLQGHVRNTSAGVVIEAEGGEAALDRFLDAIRREAPPLARIETIAVTEIEPRGEGGFSIVESEPEGEFALVSPDAAVCGDCLRETGDPGDRRYGYPFTNCTQCGPRYTIVRDIPYDRPKTTMACFTMCPACEAEYRDPSNRRFHAQPNACPECGPSLALLPSPTNSASASVGQAVCAHNLGRPARPPRAGGPPHAGDIGSVEDIQAEGITFKPGSSSLAMIRAVRRLLAEGQIVAIKGLGGFHLACDAANDGAVRRLRERKRRSDKPFALMVSGLAAAERICVIPDAECKLLESTRRPIVVLPRRAGADISAAVAPGNSTLGVMLPYTPLHHLLFGDAETGPAPYTALVMTSGNLSEEPIVTRNREAWERLRGVAEWFLFHNRDIYMRTDDSVVRVFAGRARTLRRSRGYVPEPIDLGGDVAEVLACGGELKNAFCLTKGRYAILSQHIGDLENLETLEFFEETLRNLKKLFRVEPRAVAHDLHSRYLSTRFALGLPDVEKIGVQHHHAHVASCMAENGLEGRVIGVAFDGTGYGTDGQIWGGEFLIADLAGFERLAHLRYVPLAGGDAAIRQPWRSALSYLEDALGPASPGRDLPFFESVPRKHVEIVRTMLARGINTVQTSSCGRLFDAVASLMGLRHEVNFEGQAAIELETIASEGVEDSYPFAILPGEPWQIDLRPAIRAIVADLTGCGENAGQARRPVPLAQNHGHEGADLAFTEQARSRDAGRIAAKFHNTLAAVIAAVCERARKQEALNRVCLSGGTFQNMKLLGRAVALLGRAGFEVFLQEQVPPNDGGIALGQAAIAAEILRRR